MTTPMEIVAQIDQLTDLLIALRIERPNIQAALIDAQRNSAGRPFAVAELTQALNANFDQIRMTAPQIDARFIALRDSLGDNEQFRLAVSANIDRLQLLARPIQTAADELNRQACAMETSGEGRADVLARLDTANLKLAAYSQAIAVREVLLDQLPQQEMAAKA
jgi:hypothetical protein